MVHFAVCPSSGCGGGLAAHGDAVAAPGPAEGEGPNPTRGVFSLDIPANLRGPAKLSVYDVSGRRVAAVLQRDGTRLTWNGTRDAGERLPNGVYLYRLEVGGYRREGRVVVLR